MAITKVTVVDDGYAPEANFPKSNVIIRGKYSATLLENQLLSISLANCKEIKGRIIAVLNKSQLIKLFNVSYHDFYASLKKAARRLTKIQFFTENEALGNFRISNLVTDIEWIDGSGEFSVIFNETFREQIMNLQSNYTMLNLDCLCSLDLIGSYRLYETLRSYCYYGKRFRGAKDGTFDVEIPIAELKCVMNLVDLSREEFAKFFEKDCNPDYDAILNFAYELHEADVKKDKPKKDTYPKPKYKSYNDLKRYVLEPASEEITQKTDLEVSFEAGTKGSGGKVLGVLFHVKDKKYCGEELSSSVENEGQEVDATTKDVREVDQMLDQILDYIPEKITISEARTLLTDAGYDVDKIKKAYDIVSKMKNINNLIGSLRTAIREEWEEPVKKGETRGNKKNSGKFYDFPQREYDHSELEKALVENL